MFSSASKEYIPAARDELSDDDDSTTGLMLGRSLPAVLDKKSWIRPALCLVIVVQTIAIIVLWSKASFETNPALAIWSPAQNLIEYKRVTSIPYFDERSPYLGTDTKRVDALWKDLYDDGLVSVISESEASKLLNKTRHAPNTPDLYLVQLQVFHDLHCLNLIRQWVYMDVYPDMVEWVNGTINHDTMNAMHVDHCIDALRQSVMCTSDVTPRKFAPHANERQKYVYPSIYVTQTCRNYDSIREWAGERRVVEWMMSFDEEWEQTRFNTSLP